MKNTKPILNEKRAVKYRCAICNSSFTYVRRKDKKLICRNCGASERIEDTKKRYEVKE